MVDKQVRKEFLVHLDDLPGPNILLASQSNLNPPKSRHVLPDQGAHPLFTKRPHPSCVEALTAVVTLRVLVANGFDDHAMSSMRWRP